MKLTYFVLAGSLLAQTALAGEWQLNNAESQLNFVSIKAGDVGETHKFDALSGEVAGDGKVALAIDLNSVNTAIDIRNERMREMLFETVEYPTATITAQVDLVKVEALQTGESLVQTVPAELDLRGRKSELDAELKVTRLGENKLLVSSNKPLLLNADNLGLAGGVEKLREIAGLATISLAVPVSFSLVFDGG